VEFGVEVAVALNIKNAETQRLSSELAALTGETLTTAVTIAVRERLERVRSQQDDPARRAERILALGREIAVTLSRPGIEIDDLYDERGLPA
jgi:antitoxin VapB